MLILIIICIPVRQAKETTIYVAQTSSSAKSTSSPAAFIGHDFFAHCIRGGEKINIFGMITFPGSIYQLSKAGQTHYK